LGFRLDGDLFIDDFFAREEGQRGAADQEQGAGALPEAEVRVGAALCGGTSGFVHQLVAVQGGGGGFQGAQGPLDAGEVFR
jgi:hypothetical protein